MLVFINAAFAIEQQIPLAQSGGGTLDLEATLRAQSRGVQIPVTPRRGRQPNTESILFSARLAMVFPMLSDYHVCLCQANAIVSTSP